jgi:hypothetical protein
MTELEKTQAVTEKVAEVVKQIQELNLPDTPEMDQVHEQMTEHAKELYVGLTLWGASLALTDLFGVDIQQAAEEAAADGCKTNKVWEPPEFIWLQREDEDGNIVQSAWDSEVYWCNEKIFKSDVKYRRVDDEQTEGSN